MKFYSGDNDDNDGKQSHFRKFGCCPVTLRILLL